MRYQEFFGGNVIRTLNAICACEANFMDDTKKFVCTDVRKSRISELGLPGVIEKVFYDENTPTELSVSGVTILQPGASFDMHYHNVEEIQYILYGTGTVRNSKGEEFEVHPEVLVYCGSGPEGAHAFANTGDVPLGVLWFSPSVKGKYPDTLWVRQEHSS